MKKLNNFIFDTNFREDVKAYVVLDGRKFEANDKLVLLFDKNSEILDLMFTLAFLEMTGFPTQILTHTEEEFENILSKYTIWKEKNCSQKDNAFYDNFVLDDFEKIAPYLRVNPDIESFYYTHLMIKTLRRLCPWDREQTHNSLVPEMIEEPLELVEEIKRNNSEGIKEELGDVLLQILLHAEIAKENDEFALKDVEEGLYQKMYERHPHVFKEFDVKTGKEVLTNWEKNKKKKETLNISKILASFISTLDIQDEAKYIGIEFRNKEEIFDKILEELNEVKTANENIEEEIGDLLFSVINLARYLNIDPAHALFMSYDKFANRVERFKALDKEAQEDIDKAWEKIKKEEE
jgi:tetrapyrrole methylase family protein/MazG family protein